MLHAACYMHWAWQRLVSHVWRVVNKRQIKCHCVLRAVTMANLPLSLSLQLSLPVSVALSLAIALWLHIAHTPRCTAERQQPDNLLA